MNCLNKFAASCYDDVPRNTKVINKAQFPHWLWIQLPKCVLREYELYQIDQVCPNTGECGWLGNTDREPGRPWIRVAKSVFDLNPGMHIYKLSFVSKYTDDVQYYYFGYILQDSAPAQPYVYMNRTSQPVVDSDDTEGDMLSEGVIADEDPVSV